MARQGSKFEVVVSVGPGDDPVSVEWVVSVDRLCWPGAVDGPGLLSPNSVEQPTRPTSPPVAMVWRARRRVVREDQLGDMRTITYYSTIRIGIFSCMQVLSPHPQRAPGFGHSSEAQASRVGIQRRHRVFSCKSAPLLSRRSKGVVRCSPRLRRCSNATRSVQRRLWPSVQSVGVGHSEPPVKGSRLRSLEPLCPRRMQAPTQKQEAPTSTSEGRVGPSAVGRGSSLCRFEANIWNGSVRAPALSRMTR